MAEVSFVEIQDYGHHFPTCLKEAFMNLVLGVAQLDRMDAKALQCLTETFAPNRVLNTEPCVAVVSCQQHRAAMPVALNSEKNPGERLSPVIGNAVGPVIARLKDFAAYLRMDA